jgi:hypothetical protein
MEASDEVQAGTVPTAADQTAVIISQLPRYHRISSSAGLAGRTLANTQARRGSNSGPARR